MPQQQNLPMQDKEMMNDSLSTQKELTSVYNTFANECAMVALRNEMLNILKEEHEIQATVFAEMQQRGWYQTPLAQDQKVQSAKQKFQSQG